MASGLITYAATGGSFAGGITLAAGSGGNTITIASTHRAPGTLTRTLFYTGAGSDAVTVTETTPEFLVLDLETGGDAVDATAAATSITVLGGAGDDVVTSGAGDDRILGHEGDDTIYGSAGDDDLIGGHDVAGRVDGADVIDGGAGHDVIVGDNGSVARTGLATSPRVRTLAGTTLDGGVNVDPAVMPDGIPQRTIVLFDHATGTAAGTWGADSLAGGAHDDLIFGGLGDDVIQGDGSTAFTSLAVSRLSADGAGDGDDYIEGNGGNDLIFGNLGQDDIVGGSSSLFGLGAASDRLDGADVIHGGSGTHATRNDAGDVAAGDDHGRDADMILGDNGNVYRIVGTGSANGVYTSFAYDGAYAVRIIPRVADLLDYAAVVGGLGAGDEIHGESGDDTVHGMAGDDTLYGDGQDDDLYGEAGDDWISAGTGEDAVLGDDGRIMTSRNGIAEPLYAVAATTQTAIASNADKLEATIYQTGTLRKSVDLTPFAEGGDDTVYGGLGDDSLHGGAGDDGMSGAEALAGFYASPGGTPALQWDAVTGKFQAFNDSAPLGKISGHFLNHEAFDAQGQKIDDGADQLFGGDGNDWLTGGTGSDRMFGGQGNDILNADDNLDTNGGANSSADSAAYADADTAFGGGGRDTLIGNTTADRLIDWNGNCNYFVVPFKNNGSPAIVRSHNPHILDFLIRLSRSLGGDESRTGTAPAPDHGELGLS
jgi:Ca2+-binding RTX toxin-like protein